MTPVHFAKVALLASLFSSIGANATELIVNGGFETGTMSGWIATSTQRTSYDAGLNDGRNSQVVNGGGANGPVWYVRNKNVTLLTLATPITGYSLFNGFDGDPGVFSLSQGFALTGASSEATLKFSFATQASYSNDKRQLDVNILSADGKTVLFNAYNFVLPYQVSAWSVNDVSVDLRSTFNTLGAGNYILNFKETIPQSYTGPAMLALDNVSLNVTAVPEPETYAMLLAGLGLMGLVARRRQHRA